VIEDVGNENVICREIGRADDNGRLLDGRILMISLLTIWIVDADAAQCRVYVDRIAPN
jgi:hypothetical protein